VQAPYANSRLSLIFTYAVAVLGLNLLTGYTGQISLAQGAFFGLGAYLTAICVQREIVPWPVTLIGSAVLAAVAGAVLGLPALRVRGLYLAVITLAVAIAFPPVVKRMAGLTGGFTGISVTVPGLGPLAVDQNVYYLCLIVLCLAAWLVHGLRTGPVARSFAAVRESELLATTFGLRVPRLKLQAFAVGSGLAGVAGCLYSLNFGFVAPDSFAVGLSLNLVIAMVVGGSRSIAGAVLGAAFIVVAPEIATGINDHLTGVIYGAALLICLYLLPGGIASVPAVIAAPFRRRRPRRLETTPHRVTDR
jgi:branched-chain amino acid transport system permease protein